jgi:hypothetical protein
MDCRVAPLRGSPAVTLVSVRTAARSSSPVMAGLDPAIPLKAVARDPLVCSASWHAALRPG